MELLTKEIREQIPKLYAQEKEGKNTMTYVKFFLPGSRWAWYVTEFDGKDTFFGYVKSGLDPNFDEYGYFSLEELENLTHDNKEKNLIIAVERDLYFKPQLLTPIIEHSS